MVVGENMQAFRKMANYALVRQSTMTAEMSEETVDIVVGHTEAPGSHRSATCLHEQAGAYLS